MSRGEIRKGELSGSGHERATTAAEQLAVLQAPNARRDALVSRARRHLAWFCTGVGLLLGAAHVIPVVFRPDESLFAFFIAMGLYVVALLALVFWYRHTRSATPLKGGRRYLIGFAATVLLFIAAAPFWDRASVSVALLVGLVIATPVTIAGWWRRG